MSQVRQNFHADCEEAINRQINMELYASYVYMSMSYYFDRDDIALPGLHAYFKHASDDEREHAQIFLAYQNKRGGRILLEDVKRPSQHVWGSAEEAMATALALERDVNASLLQIHGTASDHKDENFCDFLETYFLQEQVDSMKEIAGHVTNLRRVGEGLGVYQFDRDLLERMHEANEEQKPK